MAKRPFYLVKRGKKTRGKEAPYYARFVDPDTGSLSWWSTGEAVRGRAENEAQKELRRREAKRAAGPLKQIPTLEEYARSFYVSGECSWLKRQEAKGRAITATWAKARRAMLKKHVFPTLGKIPMDKLTRPMIERALMSLPISGQTKNQVLYSLRVVLVEAEADGIIQHNPLEHTEPFGDDSRKRDILTGKELRALFPPRSVALLAVWEQPKYAALFVTMAATGIREGEARAVQWQHVDPRGWLIVECAIKQDGSTGTPKNGEARVAALPSRARAILRWWYDQTPFKDPADLVFFGDAADHPMNRRTFGDVFTRALRNAEVKRGDRFLTPHSLRHGFNTMMRRAIPADTLRAMVGHKDERMSAHYDHPDVAALIRALAPARKAIEEAVKW